MKPRLFFLFLLFLPLSLPAKPRSQTQLRQWNFSRDGQAWTAVTVPHDWAISGPFDKKWDLQNVAIEQNGEKQKSEKSGRSGALPWIGKGTYKTTVSLPSPHGHYELCFDGAMSEPVVYVNGQEAGRWAYGYNAFRIDITPFLKAGDNEIRVDLQNMEESSRWYPGGGLYRPVTLVATGKDHLDDWSIFFKTLKADPTRAVAHVEATVEGDTPGGLSVEIDLYHPKGWIAAASRMDVADNGHVADTLYIDKPLLWSPETPSLYRLVTRVYKDNRLVDETSRQVGIRTISFDKEHGFRLNGHSRKFQGVCLHHDLGPLGAAVNKAALIRQVKLLKDMGADAIRTSHNMPSQMQMEVYDSLGMMVMAESFDMWKYPKCKNGYARFFDQWADKDITNLVLANRNHPSLVMYSIGNEIPEQWSEDGRKIAIHLQDLCHRLDPTRPVTQGMDRMDNALKSGFAQAMDIPGFNYRVWRYGTSLPQLPVGFELGSETASTVSSRGVYKFPIMWSNHKEWPDGQCNGYDTEWCSWSNLPEEDFIAQSDASYTIGQFVWTGFDYLGEPTPYDGYWPSRSSYFGICDLAGLPKDRYWLYRSVWNTHDHTLHILPHWTWPDRVGKVTPVFVYTDWPSAELFINGKSQGRLSKQDIKDGEHMTGKPATPADAERRASRYRLMWKDVKYEPGEVRVVAYDAEGHKAQEATMCTAGQATAVKLEADRSHIKADGDDLAYITVSLVDEKGTELPTATDEMQVEVTGAGSFRGICNGDATSLEVFTEPHMHLFSGKLVITVQAANEPGDLTVKVKDKSQPRLMGETTIRVKSEG